MREGLTNLVSDTESYCDVLKGTFEELSAEERVGGSGLAVGQALDETWVMLGVLKGALSLFPRELLVRPTGSQAE